MRRSGVDGQFVAAEILAYAQQYAEDAAGKDAARSREESTAQLQTDPSGSSQTHVGEAPSSSTRPGSPCIPTEARNKLKGKTATSPANAHRVRKSSSSPAPKLSESSKEYIVVKVEQVEGREYIVLSD